MIARKTLGWMRRIYINEMNISTAINIKKEKLAKELSNRNPDKIIVRRLEESIRRHQNEMGKMQRRRRINWKLRSYR